MNERIRELAEQAGKNIVDDKFSTYGRFAEKFAELIVGKCIAQCEQFLDDPDFTIGAMRCAIQLNQYFGVEE